jgi:hypothetical protein
VSLDYLFVVTYGRSGSTLLAGILNSIPGYLIRGENKGYVHQLYLAHSGAVARRKATGRKAKASDNAWYGIDGYDADLALERMRGLVVDTLLRPEPTTRVAGFKEIRYNLPDLGDYLQFMRQAFPGARFVFNSRDHADVLKSKWWADKSPDALTTFQQRLDEAEERHRDVSFHVHYDDYQGQPERLAPLFDFLGEELDAARVSEVMKQRHSY